MSKQGPGEMEDEEQSQDWLFGGEIQDDGGFNYMEPWNYGNSHEEYERGDQGHLLDHAVAREPVNLNDEDRFNLDKGEEDPTLGPVRAEHSWRLQAADATYFVGLADQLYASTELNEADLVDGLNDPDLFDGLDEYIEQLNGDGFHGDGTDAQQDLDAQEYPDEEMTDLTQDEEPEHGSIAVHGLSTGNGDDADMLDNSDDLAELLHLDDLKDQESNANIEPDSPEEIANGPKVVESETDSFVDVGTSTADHHSKADDSSDGFVVPTPGPPYACDHPGCEKSFPLPGELHHHQRYHTPSEQRQYICPDHPRTRFLFAHELGRHMAGPQHQTRQYICTSCRKPLSRKDNRHWKSCPRPSEGSIVLISEVN